MTVIDTPSATAGPDWSQVSRDPYPLLIDGELTVPAGRETLEVVYPFTNEVVAHVYTAAPSDVDRAVASARGAVDGDWGRATPAELQMLLRSETE
jgi:phenylacetaldehyde dehydrogenase